MTEIMTLHQPPGWKLYRLGQLFDERKQKVSDKDFPALSVTMNGIVPQLENAAKTDDGDNRKLVRAGDYVINSRSDRKGSGGISEYDGSVSLISIVLKPKGIHPRFAHHLLRSQAFQEEFYRWGHGIVADLWTTRFSDMKNIRLFLPDLASQQVIADFLDRELVWIDQLIAIKNRQAALLAERKLSAIRELAQGILLPNDKKKKTSNKWFPTVPKHWDSVRIRFLFRATKRQGWPDLDVLSVYRDFGVILKSSRDDNANKTPEDISSYQLVEPGDLVINKMKAWQGSLGIAEIRGITSPDYLVFKPIRPMVGRYIHHLLRAQPMPALFSTISNGIRTDQWRLEHNKFLDVPVWLPPIAEQQKIANEIDSRTSGTDEIVLTMFESIKRLRERRSALITAAVTGQIAIAPCKTRWQGSRISVEAWESRRA